MWIAAPWGLWLSSDFRVSMLRPGRRPEPRLDHWSPKYASATTKNGFELVLTYSGIAEVTASQPEFFRVGPDASLPPEELAILKTTGQRRKVDVSEWILWTLAGDSRTLDESVHHIAAEANKVPEFRGRDHTFVGGAFGPGGEGWFIMLNKWDVRAEEGDTGNEWASRALLKEFQVHGVRLDEPARYLAGGWGSGRLRVPDASRDLLSGLRDRRPRHPEDFMNVIARANAEAAKREPTVSPACHVMYVPAEPPADPSTTPRVLSKLYENGQTVPADFRPGVRHNVSGVDLHSITNAVMERFERELARHKRQCGEGDSKGP